MVVAVAVVTTSGVVEDTAVAEEAVVTATSDGGVRSVVDAARRAGNHPFREQLCRSVLNCIQSFSSDSFDAMNSLRCEHICRS